MVDHVHQPVNVMCSIIMDDDEHVLCPSLWRRVHYMWCAIIVITCVHGDCFASGNNIIDGK